MSERVPSTKRRHSPPERLRRRSEFVRTQRFGKRFRSDNLILLIVQRPEDRTAARVGFTVSRKVGNAVVRNRVRRRLREITRTHDDILCNGFDHVFVALPASSRAPFEELQACEVRLLRAAQKWVSQRSS